MYTLHTLVLLLSVLITGPGQVYQGHLDLAEYFDFKQPGRYRVALALSTFLSSDPSGGPQFWVSAGKFSMTLAESDVQVEAKPDKSPIERP